MPIPGSSCERVPMTAPPVGRTLATDANDGRRSRASSSLRRANAPAPRATAAGALLIGLLGNALAGAWWLDPTVGLLIAEIAVKEGREAQRGEGCCVADPLAGLAGDRCNDDCCT